MPEAKAWHFTGDSSPTAPTQHKASRRLPGAKEASGPQPQGPPTRGPETVQEGTPTYATKSWKA